MLDIILGNRVEWLTNPVNTTICRKGSKLSLLGFHSFNFATVHAVYFIKHIPLQRKQYCFANNGTLICWQVPSVICILPETDSFI